jgi:spore germination cell wall hydrolase CwlJ-like protein
MVSRALISLRLAGRGGRIIVAVTVISLLGAASALIDHSFLTRSSAGIDSSHAVVIYRTPAEADAGLTPLSGRADQFLANAGKQNRADYDDLALRAEGITAALDNPQAAPPPQEKPQLMAAAMTPIDMGLGVSAHAATHLPLQPQQDVNRGGKTDMLSMPQMVVAKLVAPVMEQPQDATGTSAALFFIAPPLNNAAETTTATAATSDDAPSEGPTVAAAAAAGAAPPHSRLPSKSTWADLVRLASVGGGDGEKIGSNIFGGLTEQQFQARELRCMATAIYFEARGETVKGQVAVGQVIMTRVNSTFYPNTICGVVYQGQWNKNACQFSFACDGVADTPHDRKEWETALDVAKNVISGKVYLDEVGDATHYHATYVSPDWKKLVKRVTKIGVHIFYKAPFVQPIVASNDFNKL